MRSLSLWARANPWTSRLLIIGGQILTTTLAIWIGKAFSEKNISLGAGLLYLLLIALFITILIYPGREQRKRLHYLVAYRWQKSCDFALLFISFWMIVCLSNQAGQSTGVLDSNTFAAQGVSATQKGKTPTAEEILASLKYRDKSTLTKAEKRILRKEFKKQVKIYIKAKLSGNKDQADQTFLIILAIAAAVGLFILLTALACSVSCGGAEGLAIALMIIGTGAIVIGTVFLIRAIQGGRTRPTKTPATASR